MLPFGPVLSKTVNQSNNYITLAQGQERLPYETGGGDHHTF